MSHVVALILAAGQGNRFEGDTPKQFAPVNGRPMIEWSIDRFAACAGIEEIFLVVAPGSIDRSRAAIRGASETHVTGFVEGGKRRQDSVRLGIAALPEAATHVLVHDAARPCLSGGLLDRIVTALGESDAVVPVVPVVDTLVTGAGGNVGAVVDRTGLAGVQTPQAFEKQLLQRAHAHAHKDGLESSDDGSLVLALKAPVKTIPGDRMNIKVTYPGDVAIAEAIIGGSKEQELYRIGNGFDVHPLKSGRKLMLGCVHFDDSPVGLDGHSDADVVAHAVCDAMLGAAGLGDIGEYFPPTDPQYEGRQGADFLRRVSDMVKKAGYEIVNVDCTVMSDAIRIGGRKKAMAAATAKPLGVDAGYVNVGATTFEGKGPVGRGEIIACEAAVLLRRIGASS